MYSWHFFVVAVREKRKKMSWKVLIFWMVEPIVDLNVFLFLLGMVNIKDVGKLNIRIF
jgi:hypothetical protein